MTADIALRSSRVVLPDHVASAVVVVRGGRVTEIRPAPAPAPADLLEIDVGDLVVSPGLVDTHVHVNEPGRTHWEGFATATRAAAAGGVTTIVDMPLNSLPPTTTLAALQGKQQAAQGNIWTDVAFWGGVTSTDVSAVAPLAEAGVCGFKVFLADSGVPEFPPVNEEGLQAALVAAKKVGLPVVVHAEAPAELAIAPPAAGPRYSDYLLSRPDAAEVAAVSLVLDLVHRTGASAHVLHLSSAEVLPLLSAAQRSGMPVTAETCPHYLSLAAEAIPDGATVAKCAPPIRETINLDRLWDGVQDGIVASVVSDHSPSPPSAKALDTGDFARAWGGISGVQTQLPVVWTAGRTHGLDLVALAQLQSTRPAQLAGLPAKGAIAVGKDADFAVWDPDSTFTVDAGALLHRHALSPWHGQTLYGIVHATWLRGRRIEVGAASSGTLLHREAA